MFKVIILGSGEMLSNLISGCLDTNCQVVGIFRYDRVRYPRWKRFLNDIFNQSQELSYIKSYDLHEIKAPSANSQEFVKEVLKLNADIILVGTWGEKLKKEVINLPKIATINAHPSLLPKYRGPNPYLQTIKNMETQSGITFHLMDEKFDTGAILLQRTISIAPDETGATLKIKTVHAARTAVAELIDDLGQEIITPLKQNEAEATYFPQITEHDMIIDFAQSAQEISAKIRGFYPFAKCYFRHRHHFFSPNANNIEILGPTELPEGTFVEKDYRKKSLTIATGDGKLIKLSNLRLFGRLNRFLTASYIKYLVKIKGEVGHTCPPTVKE